MSESLELDAALERLRVLGAHIQPDPRPGHGDVWVEIIEDMGPDHPLRAHAIARREFGVAKYGRPLQYGNGRDTEADILAERLDLAAYLWLDGRLSSARRVLSASWVGPVPWVTVYEDNGKVVLWRDDGLSVESLTPAHALGVLREWIGGEPAPKALGAGPLHDLVTSVLDAIGIEPGPLPFRLGLLQGRFTAKTKD